MAEFTFDNEPLKPKEGGFNVDLSGQASLIVKSYGLGAVKTKLFGLTVDQDKVAEGRENREFQSEGVSRFGQPMFNALTFSGSNPDDNKLEYTTLDGEEISLEPFRLDIVLFTINQVKNIVKTPISGKAGTVKEFISLDDFVVNVKGVLVSDFIDVEPEEQKEQLIKYCAAPVEIAASSTFLQSFGINSLVISTYKVEQIEGKRNVLKFELNCLSETPFEIELNDVTTI